MKTFISGEDPKVGTFTSSIIGTQDTSIQSKKQRVICRQVSPKFAKVRKNYFILKTKIGFYGIILQYLMNEWLAKIS